MTFLKHVSSCLFQIRQEIEQFGINIYQFPECDSDEDDEFQLQDQILKVPDLEFKTVEDTLMRMDANHRASRGAASI